jgi:hypothetical protein
MMMPQIHLVSNCSVLSAWPSADSAEWADFSGAHAVDLRAQSRWVGDFSFGSLDIFP